MQFDTFEQLQARYSVLTNIYRVRQALAPLIHEGLLESQQGSGTWVRRIPEVVRLPGGELAGEIAQILTDLDSLRVRVAEVHRRLSNPPIGAAGKTAVTVNLSDALRSATTTYPTYIADAPH